MFPSGHKERHDPSRAQAARPFPPVSGGFAPWPGGHLHSKATAHRLFNLQIAVATLFAASLTVSISLAAYMWRSYGFDESVPPAPALLGVFEHGAGGTVFAEGK